MSDSDYQGQTPFERAVLQRLGSIETRLDGIETLIGALGWGLIALLDAMKEDEKVRSQMRAKVSEIKNTVESDLALWLESRRESA